MYVYTYIYIYIYTSTYISSQTSNPAQPSVGAVPVKLRDPAGLEPNLYVYVCVYMCVYIYI